MITKINNINQIISWDVKNNNLKVVKNSDILIKNDKIIKIGKNLNDDKINKIIDAEDGIVSPGFIDCHTHPIFNDNRCLDFKSRIEGKSYKEISNSGGGINSSVDSLRSISKKSLYLKILPRVISFLNKGTTTIEAKSGYGLSTESEVKSLEIIKELDKNTELDIIPTFMAAHDFPKEYKMKEDEYVDLICKEMIPIVSKKKLAIFCDVFCEKGYFSIEQSRKILKTGIKYGLKPKLHADEFIDSNAANLAAEINAVSADHLMFSSIENLKKMSNKNVISVVLPGTTFFLGKSDYVDCNKIIKAGGEVAIATDFNPGSSYMQSMPFIMLLSNLYCNLSLDLSFKACTYNAARALGIENSHGLIETGYKADMLIWNLKNIHSIPYSFDDQNKLKHVIKSGRLLNWN